ncbi:MAG: maleylacetoacetate isomerase [Gammaproteobacteria bacterium]|nr:maleylacetoacetate isomerase [Gammaproteobacteria bacterium]
MKLYGYWRSSAAYRVRIALNLKQLDYDQQFIHLRQREQSAPAYLAVNPQGRVPTLELDDGRHLGQSLAIIEYLDEIHPQPPLLPGDAFARARVRQLALLIACDVHPLNNFSVLNTLTELFGADETGRSRWYRLHVEQGLRAMEALLAGDAGGGRYCHGDAPTLADVCLVPQLYNARRFGCDLSGCPTLVAIDRRCLALEAFARAVPEAQPDAQ